MSPTVFAAVVSDARVVADAATADDERVTLIDAYVEGRALTAKDRAALANAVDWARDDTFRLLVRHCCD